jgi:AcrR family transcriptional regulator
MEFQRGRPAEFQRARPAETQRPRPTEIQHPRPAEIQHARPAEFQRARSAGAKQQREGAILAAAARLGAERGIRQVTLTDIADAVGLHKSAMLRYFETREQIFLRLTADGWREWSAAVREELRGLEPGVAAAGVPAAGVAAAGLPTRTAAATAAVDTVAVVARAFAGSLADRPMFCDLLAQAPLNLERNVSIESVRAFKLVTLDEVSAISAELHLLLGLTEQQAVDVIATATSLAGALWQMATPGPEVQALYRSDPRLAHAVVDVGPRLTRVLTALLAGFSGASGPR